MASTDLESLPKECLAQVIAFTSPRDACRSSLVSAVLRGAADSDLAWERFLPSDCHEIIATAVSPVEFSSKKDLFRKLSSTPLLIDGGKMTFCLDKITNKKCYMLSARELSITWSSTSLCWCWKPLARSRFPEGVELVMVWWLEIRGKMNTSMLSPSTNYGVYLVFQLANRAFGLDVVPLEVKVEVGNYTTRGTVCMNRNDHKMRGLSTMIVERGDKWLEIELGEFYNYGSEKDVKMELKETESPHLKGGLIIEGIEVRPKH